MRLLVMGAAALLAATMALIDGARAQQTKDETDHSVPSKGQPVGLAPAIQPPRSQPNSALGFYNQGSVHLNLKEYDGAIADLDEAIKLDPKHVFALNARGLAYQSKGLNDRAIEDFNQAIALNAKNANIFTNRGRALRSKGRYDSAIADFTGPSSSTPIMPPRSSAAAWPTRTRRNGISTLT